MGCLPQRITSTPLDKKNVKLDYSLSDIWRYKFKKSLGESARTLVLITPFLSLRRKIFLTHRQLTLFIEHKTFGLFHE